MPKNYGYTLSFTAKMRSGKSRRVRGQRVFRTREEADRSKKELSKTAKSFGVKNVRTVKATKKEYLDWIPRSLR